MSSFKTEGPASLPGPPTTPPLEFVSVANSCVRLRVSKCEEKRNKWPGRLPVLSGDLGPVIMTDANRAQRKRRSKSPFEEFVAGARTNLGTSETCSWVARQRQRESLSRITSWGQMYY